MDVSLYGIVTGVWEDKGESMMNISKMTEKPTMAYAYDHLRTPTQCGQDKYFSVFGQYVLTPEVFKQLHVEIINNNDSVKEIDLTSALEEVRKKTGLYGVRLKGEMFDMGNPKAYNELMKKY